MYVVLTKHTVNPAGQILMHASRETLPSDDEVPVGQASQADDNTPPVVVRYVPAAHRIHTLKAADGPYVPISQSAQITAPLSPAYFPASQFTQTVIEGRLAALPASHTTHGPLPGTPLYLPAIQAPHVAPFSPVCPELHVQASAEVLCTPELEFARQSAQIAAPSVEYFPAPQS